ncbi:ATP-binding protein [Salinibaculum salinum]|uniref:AlbA family DNA-binding domain-containing protein n=1 Tax=Salinibaculum salinum TaxID=3131996 RepID=UPI0030EF106C
MTTQQDGLEAILDFFRSGEYSGHGRGHIDTISEAFLSDIVAADERIQRAATDGELVKQRNFNTTAHQFSRDIDLAVGEPAAGDSPGQQGQLPTAETTVQTGEIETVWLSLNIESLISSVGKNWKNRGEDIYVFYLTVYDSYNLSVTGSILLLNVAGLEDGMATNIIDAFEEFEFADGSIAQTLDSMAVIPLEYDDAEPAETTLADGLVPTDHPLHYTNFISVMTEGLARRIEGDFEVSAESLESVLAETETEVLEFKEKLDDVSDIAKEAVAFANHDGGSILIGVDDSANVVGLDDVETAEERVAGILDNVEPGIVKDLEKATYEGKDVLIINILRATNVPASYNGTFYLRQGTSKHRMNGHELLQTFPRE